MTICELLEQAIGRGGYDLAAVTAKIDALWVEGKLSDDDRAALAAKAQAGARPADSLAPLADRVAALEVRVQALEAGKVETPDETPADEWPEWVQPTGAHDAYSAGDKMTFGGKRYTCTMDGCVWSPAVYPAAWNEVAE